MLFVLSFQFLSHWVSHSYISTTSPRSRRQSVYLLWRTLARSTSSGRSNVNESTTQPPLRVQSHLANSRDYLGKLKLHETTSARLDKLVGMAKNEKNLTTRMTYHGNAAAKKFRSGGRKKKKRVGNKERACARLLSNERSRFDRRFLFFSFNERQWGVERLAHLQYRRMQVQARVPGQREQNFLLLFSFPPPPATQPAPVLAAAYAPPPVLVWKIRESYRNVNKEIRDSWLLRRFFLLPSLSPFPSPSFSASFFYLPFVHHGRHKTQWSGRWRKHIWTVS